MILRLTIFAVCIVLRFWDFYGCTVYGCTTLRILRYCDFTIHGFTFLRFYGFTVLRFDYVFTVLRFYGFTALYVLRVYGLTVLRFTIVRFHGFEVFMFLQIYGFTVLRYRRNRKIVEAHNHKIVES